MEKNISGHLHPTSLIINRAVEIFENLGFSVASGPELETEWYNFDALNVPKDHPARDMQDTFWVETNDGSRKLLRTQTSSVQIHTMEKWAKTDKENPIAIVVPGKVFRNEATDATHEANFYQLECLYVDKKENVSVGNLKWIIEKMLSEIFKRETVVRFRSSYFPFVEPALEVDMSCFRCGGSGCSTCKHSGFIELGGSGMVHPNVLAMCGIDSKEYSGFAFGFGIERIAMMLYGIEDIRLLYSADLRLTSQF
jgi:phenylalanyl-tRNA synthetase alpha chain